MVVDCAEEVYKFLIDAEWLTMPTWRFTDSLGACSSSMTVETTNRSAWFTYNKKIVTKYEYEDGRTEWITDESVIHGDCPESDFRIAGTSYGWCGSAVLFNLPNNDYGSGESGEVTYTRSITCSNFKIHYEFEGKIIYPDQTVNFNSIATYCHKKLSTQINPELTIGTEGYGVAIGLGFGIDFDNRGVSIPDSIQYKPD